MAWLAYGLPSVKAMFVLEMGPHVKSRVIIDVLVVYIVSNTWTVWCGELGLVRLLASLLTCIISSSLSCKDEKSSQDAHDAVIIPSNVTELDTNLAPLHQYLTD